MFLPLSDNLLLVKLSYESSPFQNQKIEKLGRRTETFKLPTTRTEGAKSEFILGTCRLINNLPEFIEFSVMTGLKEKFPAFMWKFVNSVFVRTMSAAG